MGVTKEQVESTLKSSMNPSHLVTSSFPCSILPNLYYVHIDTSIFKKKKKKKEVVDTSGGCGASFTVVIVSEEFQGKRLLERHRMVNTALVEEMKEIHALSITKALTPEQWKQQETQKSEAAE